MKIKTSNKTRDYESVFTKEKEIKEIELCIGDFILHITEQQCGVALDKPYITIITNDGTYSMDFETFIKNGILT